MSIFNPKLHLVGETVKVRVLTIEADGIKRFRYFDSWPEYRAFRDAHA